jgi:hypothetical protein
MYTTAKKTSKCIHFKAQGQLSSRSTCGPEKLLQRFCIRSQKWSRDSSHWATHDVGQRLCHPSQTLRPAHAITRPRQQSPPPQHSSSLTNTRIFSISTNNTRNTRHHVQLLPRCSPAALHVHARRSRAYHCPGREAVAGRYRWRYRRIYRLGARYYCVE